MVSANRPARQHEAGSEGRDRKELETYRKALVASTDALRGNLANLALDSCKIRENLEQKITKWGLYRDSEGRSRLRAPTTQQGGGGMYRTPV